MPRKSRERGAFILALFFSFGALADGALPKFGRASVLEALKRSSRFMMNTVSRHGGLVSVYTSDLSEQWGEIPARKSQIWVQTPGTVSVGRLMLRVYDATGDREYLDFAERAARALIYGQHPTGGWHYFIDFDPEGVPEYYEKVASQCWGFEEFYHYYGNATFDDGVHSETTRFLLELYLATLDPRYRAPLDRALSFVLTSQFPNGGWPQRFPLHEGYSSYYTFNDGVTGNNIRLLLEAYRKLGHPGYLQAARRGMDFVVLSQLPPPQAGWALQYDFEMKPAKARNFEPAGVATAQTIECIGDLQEFYKITGNRNFLRGIPDAIRWLESSVLNGGKGRVYEGKTYTHASFYEPGTNNPIYAHRRATRAELDPKDPMLGYWFDGEFGNFTQHYGEATTVDLEPIKNEFARVSALTPEQAREEYEKSLATPAAEPVSAEEARSIIAAMDSRGAWVQEMFMKHYPDFRDRAKGRTIQAIQVAVFEKNVARLIDFLRSMGPAR